MICLHLPPNCSRKRIPVKDITLQRPRPVKHQPAPISRHRVIITAELMAAAVFLKKLLRATVEAALLASISVKYVMVVLLHQARPKAFMAENANTRTML